jgi:VCBS repeat-containing protein
LFIFHGYLMGAACVVCVEGQRVSTAPTLTYLPTGNAYVDGVLSGTKWAVSGFTFSFPTSASYYGSGYGSGEPSTGFEAFNATQQAATIQALAMYSAVANLTFTEMSETASSHAVLRYAMSDVPGTAWAYYPNGYFEEGGDAWFGNSSGWYDNPVMGNYAFASIVHETGHALGLKHPHEASGSFGAMPADKDSIEYSVMSYRSYVGAGLTGYTASNDSFPQTLMMYDIAALQQMYGANFTTNAGDTVYSWSATTGRMSINGVAQTQPAGNKIFMTLWDGGGVDTYDFSNYATGLTVNLQPGNWTTASAVQLAYLGNGHYAAGNIANALLYNNNTASLVENAVGGSAGDTMVGNQADNLLTGRGGNDGLDGLGGVNTAGYSGASGDYSWVENANGTWTVVDLRPGSPDGTDTLANIQYLRFTDQTVALADEPDPPPPPPPPPVNHAPVAANDAYTVAKNVQLVIAADTGVLANDTDVDGDALSAILVKKPAYGTLALGDDGSFVYTPKAGYTGKQTFTYKVSDGTATSNTVTVTLNVINNAPVAGTDEYSTGMGTRLVVPKASGLLANDSDPNGDKLKAVLVSKPKDGTVKLNADGSFTFTPKAGFVGTATFTYKVSDGKLSSPATTVSIDVLAPGSAAPLIDTSIVARDEGYATGKASVLSVGAAAGVLANETGNDGVLAAMLVSGPKTGSLALAEDGSFVYTPDGTTTGNVSFTYRVSDGDGLSALATATIALTKTTTGKAGTGGGESDHRGGQSQAELVSLVLGASGDDGASAGDGFGAVAWALDSLFDDAHQSGGLHDVSEDALPAPTGLPDYLQSFYSEFVLF